MHYYIITGTSKGLGEAIARSLLEDDHYLFCISRQKNNQLIGAAYSKDVELNYYIQDLQDHNGLQYTFKEIVNKIDMNQAKSITLINNAAMIHPIKRVESCTYTEIDQHLAVNLGAPMMLSSMFIDFTKKADVRKRIINITSGAANKPFYGWSNYCSGKAALDMFTKCVAEEQKNTVNPVHILGFSPGIMDTTMQQQIRNVEEENFIRVEEFKNFKEQELLRTPEFVAKQLILLMQQDITSGSVVDIKELV
ncbi:(S)-benzoin forming benzil reductase [Vallitalea okinawensis]|uniref:(S)-benzoin forming benzil reductase n=1 Tax=Vallitalea okinawensis TaxID=2078660 RepID=UPI000CFD3821|nr:(S)-benzoin forming benzil reductase [Vallitalea okinawensis]